MSKSIRTPTDPPVKPTQKAPSLAVLESIIKNGLQNTEAVAEALFQIHERKLYRGNYPTFEVYLSTRWNLSRSRGYQLLHFAKSKHRGATTNSTAPRNERQARRLGPDGKQRPERPGAPPVSVALNYLVAAVRSQPLAQRRAYIESLWRALSDLEKEVDGQTVQSVRPPELPPELKEMHPHINENELIIENELPSNR
jgi:hypothetical protein